MPFTDRAEALEKVREAQKRLETEGNPLGINVRERTERVSPQPTVQREAKARNGFADVILREQSGRYVPTRRERSPMELHAKCFSEDELFIAAQFINDAEVATRVNITAAYDGSPRQVSGPRSGGVPDKNRMAHMRFTNVWGSLPAQFQNVAKWLVLEVRRESTGESVTVADIGSEVCGIRDKATARGIGVGLLKATLWRIGELYRKEGRR